LEAPGFEPLRRGITGLELLDDYRGTVIEDDVSHAANKAVRGLKRKLRPSDTVFTRRAFGAETRPYTRCAWSRPAPSVSKPAHCEAGEARPCHCIERQRSRSLSALSRDLSSIRNPLITLGALLLQGLVERLLRDESSLELAVAWA
jgi:hypothetical protein